MRGRIEAIKQGTTNDGSIYKIYTINGAQYSTFKFLGFKEGQEVEFEGIQKGKYKNLIAMGLSAGGAGSKDDLIIREVATKAAAEAVKMVHYQEGTTTNVAQDVITMAKEFEEYIKGEEEPKPEEEMPF